MTDYFLTKLITRISDLIMIEILIKIKYDRLLCKADRKHLLLTDIFRDVGLYTKANKQLD